MSKKAYAERMFMKISWETNFRLFSTFISSFITICNKKYEKDADAEKEAWRSICLSSQRHYPIKISKAWNVCYISGIACRVKRLEGGDANMLFGTKCLPIISNEDPIIGKLIRLAHLGDLEGKGAMHRTTSGTMGRLQSGKFGITTTGIEQQIMDFSYGCYGCNVERGVT